MSTSFFFSSFKTFLYHSYDYFVQRKKLVRSFNVCVFFFILISEEHVVFINLLEKEFNSSNSDGKKETYSNALIFLFFFCRPTLPIR